MEAQFYRKEKKIKQPKLHLTSKNYYKDDYLKIQFISKFFVVTFISHLYLLMISLDNAT